MSSSISTSFKTLPHESVNMDVGFSVEDIKKMWLFGIMTNDVSYLKSLVRQDILPDDELTEKLLYYAIEEEADKVLSWFLHSKMFQKQVAKKNTVKALEKVINKILNLDWNDDIKQKEKIFFNILDIISPYMFNKKLYKNKDGDTLPTLLLNINPYMLGEENWRDWLLKPEVIPALLEPNKKGNIFFEIGKKNVESMFSGSKRDIDYFLCLSDELEMRARKKIFDNLPNSKNNKMKVRL